MEGETPTDRLNRELWALLPVLLTDASRMNATPRGTAERVIRVVMRCATPLIDTPSSADGECRAALLELADHYYREGHTAEREALRHAEAGEVTRATINWERVSMFQLAYTDLCALVDKLDLRPGGAGGATRPW